MVEIRILEVFLHISYFLDTKWLNYPITAALQSALLRLLFSRNSFLSFPIPLSIPLSFVNFFQHSFLMVPSLLLAIFTSNFIAYFDALRHILLLFVSSITAYPGELKSTPKLHLKYLSCIFSILSLFFQRHISAPYIITHCTKASLSLFPFSSYF